MSKSILYLQYVPNESTRRKLQGVQKYASKHGWSVTIIEECRKIDDISQLLTFWKPDGCIADCSGVSRAFSSKSFGKIPVVFLNRATDDPRDHVASVYHNQRQPPGKSFVSVAAISHSSASSDRQPGLTYAETSL